MKKIHNTISGIDTYYLKKTLLTMKITTLLLIVNLLHISAIGYSQSEKLNLNLQNASLKEMFAAIEKQTDYKFLYRDDALENVQVSIATSDAPLNEILQKILENSNSTYKILDNNLIVIASKETLQQKKVTGTITDASTGEPIIGANLIIEGTTSGTITGVNGKFSLEVNDGAVIVISFLGYMSERITINGQLSLDVKLIPDITKLEEVVVVGYGTQKKKKSHLTAAVDQISGEILQNRPLRSIADGLKGMVAGLNISAPNGAPEAGLNINVRGFTGFGSSAQPLILVDGIERNINDINPNDVASVSVLKDGAASAIYGSRAPFGVILITTKMGSKGDKMKISYSGNFSFGTPAGLPTFLPSYEFAGYLNAAFRNAPGGGGAAFHSDLQIAQMKAYAAGDFTNAVFNGINPEDVPFGVTVFNASQWGAHQQVFGNTNWFDLALKDVVPSQKHSLSVSGGSDKTTYYVGLGYNENEGIFKGPNYKNTYSSLIKFDTKLTKWIDFNVGVNYVSTDDEGPNYAGQGRNYASIFNTFARSNPHWVPLNPNGTPYRFSPLPNLMGQAGTEGESRSDITLSGDLILEPVKNLKIVGNYTWRNNSSKYLMTTLQVMQILPNGTLTPNQRTVGNNSIVKKFSTTGYHTIDLHATYSKTIQEKHNFYGLFGYQEEENSYSQLQGSATNLYSDAIQTLSTSSANFKTSDILYAWASRGIFGRFSYNYDLKYFIEFNVRHDATSRFLKDTRWATFPSVSGAWNVAKEKFWSNNDLISLFKIRGSWSTSGNNNVDVNNNDKADPFEYYLFYPTINTSISNSIILGDAFVSTASLPNLVNNTLTWAKPTTIDFGFDMNALKNRLEVNYDWYQRTVKDQFGPANPLPETLGANVPQSNNAVSETRGWEVNLRWKDRAFNLLKKPFKYDVSFRLSDYVGYVVKYQSNGTGSTSGTWKPGEVFNGQWTPGEVFGQNYMYVSNGIAQNVQDLNKSVPQSGTWFYPGDLLMKDLNGDGEINGGTTGTWYSRGDLVKNGFNYPRKRYGISLGAEWNNFDLSLELEGIGQWKVFSTNLYVWGNSGNQFSAPYFKENADLGYWTPTNTEAFYPRDAYDVKNKVANDQYTLDLSNLRIRNLKMGYNLPKPVLNKLKLDRIYLYMSAENLGFIYYNSFIKYDPELLAASGGEGYPPQRVMSFGINVEF